MTTTSTEPMAENAADLETEHLFGRPLPQCPRCGNRHLETVVEADAFREVHFFCSVCDRCWRVELGFAQPIAPGACRRNRDGTVAKPFLQPFAKKPMRAVPAVPIDDVDVNEVETLNAAQDGSFSRRSQAEALVALAGGRRELLEQRLVEFQNRLHHASNDFAATEGLRVVEAALRLVPRTSEK